MSPACLRADAHLTVLRGVARLIAIELDSQDYGETSPEIIAARDAVHRTWTPEERDKRWRMAHQTWHVADSLEQKERQREYNRRASERFVDRQHPAHVQYEAQLQRRRNRRILNRFMQRRNAELGLVG